MIEMLSGALIFAYLLAGTHFLKFWRRTRDRLFLHFAVAFWLFSLNQLVSSLSAMAAQTAGYEYLLRVFGYVIILVGIVEKNLPARPTGE